MKNFLKRYGLLLLLLLLGSFLRFYNLNWGSPYYFHPDERQNVAYPILQSNSLFMLDQKKFDTGTFPLMVIKLTQFAVISLFPYLKTLDQVALIIIISRMYSAVFSTFILLLLFFFCKKVFGQQKAYLTLSFATFSTGFIQFSHFGTIEIWEALFFLLLFFFCWNIAKHGHWQTIIFCSVIAGIALASKVLTAIILPGIFFSLCFYLMSEYRHKKILLKNIRKVFFLFFLFVITTLGILFILSPQILYNFQGFYSDSHYESQVSLGTLRVFYTQGFFHTTPIFFQFFHIYPFLLNPLITVLFIVSFIVVFTIGIKKRKYSYILLITFYLLLFLSQAFFFAKWTRYMVPVLPFVYLILGVGIDDLLHILKRIKTEISGYLFITVPLVISFLFSIAFLITVYIQPDTRIAASAWAKDNIPGNANILTESYDIGILPFNQYFPSIMFFDFYNLDRNSVEKLVVSLSQSDYILLPSQRLIKSRLTNKNDFPQGNLFYNKLVNGQLGFSKIYETSCDVFCNIIYLGNPVFSFEETANVFDRPTVFIFKKMRRLPKEEYITMLQ